MPLVYKEEKEGILLGIWQMDEPLEQLELLLPRAMWQEGRERFAAEHRRKEWLAVRLLLKTLTGDYVPIQYHPSGKPYISEGPCLSISHTKNHVAVILGNQEVGIDVEQYGARVEKVISRFMREDEQSALWKEDALWGWLLHWSAKETMYKMLHAEGVDFVKHLRIYPFQMAEDGLMEAVEYKTAKEQKFRIHYRLFPDFVLTWGMAN